jgi:hypothetical protein
MVFANPAGDFATLIPSARVTDRFASSIFARGSTSAGDGPIVTASISRDSFGEGSEVQLVPISPPWPQTDAMLNFIPAGGTGVIES